MTTQIAEYSKTEAALAELNKRHAGAVFEVTTTTGMTLAKQARAEVRGYRTALENMRKEIKAPALERCQMIDAEAKRITAELLKLETPIDEQIKAEETRKEKEKEALAEIERKRIADIRQNIATITGIPSLLKYIPGSIKQSIDELESLNIGLDNYYEFAGEAMQAKSIALETMREMLAESERRIEEAAKLEADRIELARLKAEAAEREAKAAQERAEADAKAKAERDKLEAELNAQRAAQEEIARKQQAELDKQRMALEAQKAEQERKEREHQESLRREAAARQAEIDKAEALRQAAIRAEQERIESIERAVIAERQRVADEEAEQARIEEERKQNELWLSRNDAVEYKAQDVIDCVAEHLGVSQFRAKELIKLAAKVK